jgi:hypothetical protein
MANHKRGYRLYREEGLAMRRHGKRFRSEATCAISATHVTEPDVDDGFDATAWRAGG